MSDSYRVYASKDYVDSKFENVDSKFENLNSKLTNGVELPSTTDGSTKRFLLTVDDQCLLTLIDQDTGEEVSVSGGIALTAAEGVDF